MPDGAQPNSSESGVVIMRAQVYFCLSRDVGMAKEKQKTRKVLFEGVLQHPVTDEVKEPGE